MNLISQESREAGVREQHELKHEQITIPISDQPRARFLKTLFACLVLGASFWVALFMVVT